MENNSKPNVTACGAICGSREDPEYEARLAKEREFDRYYRARRIKIAAAAKGIAAVAIKYKLTASDLMDAAQRSQEYMCFAELPYDLQRPEEEDS